MKIVTALLTTLVLVACGGSSESENDTRTPEPCVRISVPQSGRILVDGVETTIPEVEKRLLQLKSQGGSVWYYREAGQQEPPLESMQVIKLVAENRLPITFSSKPDFSDYIDEKGQSHPRE